MAVVEVGGWVEGRGVESLLVGKLVVGVVEGGGGGVVEGTVVAGGLVGPGALLGSWLWG